MQLDSKPNLFFACKSKVLKLKKKKIDNFGLLHHIFLLDIRVRMWFKQIMFAVIQNFLLVKNAVEDIELGL